MPPALRRVYVVSYRIGRQHDGCGYQAPSKAAGPAANAVVADLIAVLVAVTGAEPLVLTVQDATALPSGPFKVVHRSLQAGLRTGWRNRLTIRSAMSSSSTPSPTATARSMAVTRFRSAISA
ncbi:MAG: hypothetical protein WDN49_01300 [Acetobacteraceae bacterium]